MADCTPDGEGTCPCGKGKITLQRCVPDHGWPSDHVWWEEELRCEECKKIYEFFSEATNERPKLVKKEDVLKRRSKEGAWRKKHTEIMTSNSVKELMGRFVKRLDGEKSIAAKYRLLAKFGLVDGVETTFRRNFRGTEDYVANRKPHELPKVQSLLAESDPTIESDLKKLEQLREEMKERVPAVKTSVSGLLTF